MNVLLVAALSSAAAFGLGGWVGVRWERGEQAIAAEAAKERSDALIANQDAIAIAAGAAMTTLSNQLGDARVRLNKLTNGRDCLQPDAVRLLNAAGAAPVPAAASRAASAPDAFATDRDVGDALAICRSRYGQLAEQLNAILDIEEQRTSGNGQ